MVSQELYPVLFNERVQEHSSKNVECCSEDYLLILIRLQMMILLKSGIKYLKLKNDILLSTDSLELNHVDSYELLNISSIINNFYAGHFKTSYWNISFLDMDGIEDKLRSVYNLCSETIANRNVEDGDENVFEFEIDFASGEISFMFCVVKEETGVDAIEWSECESYGKCLNSYVDKTFVYDELSEIRHIFDKFFGKELFLDLREEILYYAMNNVFDIWNPEFDIEVVKYENKGIELWKDYALSHMINKSELEERAEYLFKMYNDCIVKSCFFNINSDEYFSNMSVYNQIYYKEVDDVLDSLSEKYSDFSPVRSFSPDLTKDVLEVAYV